MDYRHKEYNTLCWECSRSTDSSCNWSKSARPVEGWIATKSDRRTWYLADSFCVHDCPLFTQEETNLQREISDIGVERLLNAVIARAAQDYKTMLEAETSNQRRDPALNTKRALYGKRVTDKNFSYKRKRRGRRPKENIYNKIYRYNNLHLQIKDLEKWFMSEQALMYSHELNPRYIMEQIRRAYG